MGFQKMLLLTLMVVVVLLLWPQMTVAFYKEQMEEDLTWRAYIRIASEDSALKLKNSSYGYGEWDGQINEYDFKESIHTFFQSIESQAPTSALLGRELINKKIPLVLVLGPRGYVVSYNANIQEKNENNHLTTREGNIEKRVTLPVRRYAIEDDNAIYFLDYGKIITCVSKKNSFGDIDNIIEGDRKNMLLFLSGNLDEVILRVKSNQELSAAYPLLKKTENANQLKYLFLSKVFEEVEKMVSSPLFNQYIGTIQSFVGFEGLENFEFTGTIAFLLKRQFGTKICSLERVSCFQKITRREEVYGYLVKDKRIYCTNNRESHELETLIAIFPDNKTAAEHGFYPCDCKMSLK